jgi:outer membrane receptor for ferrienterochelin and colicins
MVSASHFSNDGEDRLYYPEFDSPENNNGIAKDMDQERADRLFLKWQYQNFTLNGGYVDRFKRIPTAAWESIFNDSALSNTDTQFYGNIQYHTALASHTDFTGKVFYNGYDYKGKFPYEDGQRILNKDKARGRWWGGELQLTTQLFEKQRIILGLEYQYDQHQYQSNYDVNPYEKYLDKDRNGHRVELYFQDDIQLFDSLILSAGARLDYHHMLQGLQLNPRLGLIWNPTETTAFKLLYSSTFRAPNAWERDYESFITEANPDNYEEKIDSYELASEWHVLPDLKLTANLFFNHISQLLEQENEPDYGSNGPFINEGHYDIFGFELEAEKRFANGRLLKASYTYSDATDESDGGEWAYASPKNLFKLHYAEPLFDHFATIGIENIFVDERRTPQHGIADAYYQLNINLTSDRLIPGLDISAGAYNLFDTHYEMYGGTGPADITQNVIPMNGREFRLKLQWTF